MYQAMDINVNQQNLIIDIDEQRMYEAVKHDICGFQVEHQQVMQDIVYVW